MKRKSNYLPRKLTRKERKDRQNLFVWFGMSRGEAKTLRTYAQFVQAYAELTEKQLSEYSSLDLENRTVNGSEEEFEDLLEKLNDGTFDPAATELSTAAMANSILMGQMGLTTGDLKGITPTTERLYAEKHYLHVKDVKTGEIVDVSASYPSAGEVKAQGKEIKKFINDAVYQQFIKPIKDQFNNGC